MGLRPEFSARAMGMDSRASENARMAYCSMVDIWRSRGRGKGHTKRGREGERESLGGGEE